MTSTTLTADILVDILGDASALPFLHRVVSLAEMTELAQKTAPKLDAYSILRLAACDSVTEGTAVLAAALGALTPRKVVQFEAGCLALTSDRWNALGYDPTVPFALLFQYRVPDLKKLKAWQALCKRPLDLADHWARTVASAIQEQDWLAAWEAVRIAHLGHPQSAAVPLEQLKGWTPWVTLDRLREQRLFFIPQSNCRKLIMDLFEAMQLARLVECGLQEMRKADSTVSVKAGTRTMKVPRPGLLEMTGFFTRMTPGQEWPIKLDPVGSMVLGLAQWANQQKKEVGRVAEAEPALT